MNAHGKSVDSSCLSIDRAEERGFIHRDYIAHCHRWTFVIKRMLTRKEEIVLDVGCGREMPLAKMIYSSKMRSRHYCGIDVLNAPVPDALRRVSTFPIDRIVGDIADVVTFQDIDLPAAPSLIVCFEMMEHVEHEHAIRCLQAMRRLAGVATELIISTPCWDGKHCAKSHVNELTYEAFGAMLEDAGWAIIANYGTFASIRDYKHLLTDGQKEVFNQLRPYYDTNMLSTIFAPMFPAQSRNCLWYCDTSPDCPRRFKPLVDIPHPWGSADTSS